RAGEPIRYTSPPYEARRRGGGPLRGRAPCGIGRDGGGLPRPRPEDGPQRRPQGALGPLRLPPRPHRALRPGGAPPPGPRPPRDRPLPLPRADRRGRALPGPPVGRRGEPDPAPAPEGPQPARERDPRAQRRRGPRLRP